MSVVLTALLLGASVSPPPDDDAHAKDRATKVAPAQSAEQDSDGDEGRGHAQPNGPIVVNAKRLDAARTQIDAGLGATVYSLTNDAIENRPGGETGSISDILTQVPGVTLSGKVLNVRGSPANQLRINNVIIPEAISDPADLISSRLAETTNLLTGTLPAQFGFAPAGVIGVTTKNGLYQHGGQAELFAGSDGMVEPAFEWAGSAAATSLFVSGELERSRTRIADLDGNWAEDRRLGIDGLGFADHVIDAGNRVSMIFGGSHEHDRFGKTGIGSGDETNDDGYGVATYQHTDGNLTLQSSLFVGFASDDVRFTSPSHERRTSWGAQIDGSEELGPAQTLRFGLLASHATASELDIVGDRSSGSRTSISTYVQDEWKLSSTVTFNPGARLEWLRGFNSSASIEPRASLVWASPAGTTAHVGYARYALAPPLDECRGGMNLADERDDYFDAGVQQKLGALTLGIDGYWRSARNLIAEYGEIGSAFPIAFEFKRGHIRGVEFSGTYARRGTTAWANLSLSHAKASSIVGGDSLFATETIAATATRFLPLSSDRPVTMTGGVTQRVGKFSIGGQVFVSSGAVRTLSITNPNGGRHRSYALVGLAAVYHARIAGQPADLRLDLTNLTNVHYLTSDASNLEGGWTRWGRRRAISIGIEQGF